MESLYSFLVGLFHSLQHAGLSRRTLINAVPDMGLARTLHPERAPLLQSVSNS
jgi:hypothetical protein